MKNTKTRSKKSGASSSLITQYKVVRLCTVGCPINGQLIESENPMHFTLFDCELCSGKGMEMTLQHLVDIFVTMSEIDPRTTYSGVAAAEDALAQRHFQNIKERYH